MINIKRQVLNVDLSYAITNIKFQISNTSNVGCSYTLKECVFFEVRNVKCEILVSSVNCFV